MSCDMRITKQNTFVVLFSQKCLFQKYCEYVVLCIVLTILNEL